MSNDHQENCNWEKTKPEDCEFKNTHYYCPHPEHACSCIKPWPHEHNFAEEKEPSGRLILSSCLTCGVEAGDAMKMASDELSKAHKDVEILGSLYQQEKKLRQNLEAENSRLREDIKTLTLQYAILDSRANAQAEAIRCARKFQERSSCSITENTCPRCDLKNALDAIDKDGNP